MQLSFLSIQIEFLGKSSVSHTLLCYKSRNERLECSPLPTRKVGMESLSAVHRDDANWLRLQGA